MNIRPLTDHILIEPSAHQEATKSGILLPETIEKDKSGEGTVIAAGPGKKTPEGKIIPLDVKAGDKVLFSKYGPNEIKVETPEGEKEYLIAKEEDIFAVIE
ncbi:MAG: co-chaperone GroES [Candidatus Parcubacteria bacterium]|nr:co-chaperone GroES [Candidatus Parcubacteria bacterium]